MENYTTVELGKENNLLDELEHKVRGYKFNIYLIAGDQIVFEHSRENKKKNIYITFYMKTYESILAKNGYEISDFIEKNYEKIKAITYTKSKRF